MVSILTHRLGWVQPHGCDAADDVDLVSILTHRLGWVQPAGAPQDRPSLYEVSILTHRLGWGATGSGLLREARLSIQRVLQPSALGTGYHFHGLHSLATG